MNVAFYAPMKAADHPVPSGDRTMARLLIAALRAGGHAVEVVSTLRTWLPEPDPEGATARFAAAAREIDRITEVWALDPTRRPDLWLTYHNHYKAPDLLGPTLARRFALPLVIAEASHAPKRATAWGPFHAAAEAASRAADAHLCFTARDRVGIAAIARADAVLTDLPPFIDLADEPERPTRRREAAVPRIATVAMMRAGDKAASYAFLAEALGHIEDRSWHLSVIGDGPAATRVHAAFGRLAPDRITWHGAVERPALMAELARSDLYAWPGFGEAFGLGYLEAQAMGCPVVALDIAGTSSVVRHGITGLLVGDASPVAYAAALRSLLDEPIRRQTLGEAGAAWVRQERTLPGATAIIDPLLRNLGAASLRCCA